MADVPQNPDGSYTLYNSNGMTVTLRFPTPPAANFKVVTKDLQANLPPGYTWLFNFGIQNPGGQYLPSVSYSLEGSPLANNKSWFMYYGDDPDPQKNVHAMNGNHTTPGDPPVGMN